MKHLAAILATVIAIAGGLVLLNNSNSDIHSGSPDSDDFEPGRIMDDSVMANSGTMNTSQIQQFIEDRVNKSHCGTEYTCLYTYEQNPDTGEDNYGKTSSPSGAISASRIIYNYSQEHDINPQVLLVLLQKEQGLLSATSPSDNQYRSATGYGCPDTAGCDENYYGFSNQVEQAAKYFRDFLNDDRGYNYYPPGWNDILYHPNHSCGSSSVYVENLATSALYNYTPYQPNQAALDNLWGSASGSGAECATYGNRNFWRDFNNWFGSTTESRTANLITCDGSEYIIERSHPRRRALSSSSYEYWGLNDITPLEYHSRCGNSVYGLELDRMVRSRTTERIYWADEGTVYRVRNQVVADAWDMGENVLNEAWPQMDGSTIHHFTNVESHVPRVVTSTNTSRSAVYVIDNGKFYQIAGTSNDEDAYLELIMDRNEIGTIAPDTILGLEDMRDDAPRLEIAFEADNQWHLLNNGGILTIDPDNEDLFPETLSGPSFSTQSLSILDNHGLIEDAWRTSDAYYRLVDGSIEKTSDEEVAQAWNVHNSPKLSDALVGLLPENTPALQADKEVAYNDVFIQDKDDPYRFFTCGDEAFVKEDSHSRIRRFSDYAAENWGLDTDSLPEVSDWCDRSEYAMSMDDLLRSRNTGRVYLVRNGEARLVDTEDAAASWGIQSDFNERTYPQFDPDTIHFLDVVYELEHRDPDIGASNIRVFSCGEQEYMVERFRRRKRELTREALNRWQLDDAHFPEDERRCDYRSYDLELKDIIRSRTTDRTYEVEGGTATSIEDDGNIYPQFDGDSIHYLEVK